MPKPQLPSGRARKVLPLHQLLGPWTLPEARPAPEAPPPRSPYPHESRKVHFIFGLCFGVREFGVLCILDYGANKPSRQRGTNGVLREN
jgi:hypothetical protein